MTKRELNIIACCKVLLMEEYNDEKLYKQQCKELKWKQYPTAKALREVYVNKIIDLVYKKIKV